jgi:hypothetical protein
VFTRADAIATVVLTFDGQLPNTVTEHAVSSNVR